MKKETRYREAYTSTCLIIGLLGLGTALNKDPHASWMTVPIFFAILFLFGFNAYMTLGDGGGHERRGDHEVHGHHEG